MQAKTSNFIKRFRRMLGVDARRMLLQPTLYIMLGISFALPVLILVMTSFVGASPEQGADAAAMTFTNVWQAFGSASGSGAAMDMTSMCNANLLFILAALYTCIFVAEDFRSGYAKNLFAVRASKSDYVASKTVVCVLASVAMLLCYFVGAMLGGGIAGLSFDVTLLGATAGGVIASLVAKAFLFAVFVPIALTLAVVGRQKLWLSILCTLGACMLLFMMIPMITPLDANFLHVVMCLAGGAMFAAGLGALSGYLLNRLDLAR